MCKTRYTHTILSPEFRTRITTAFLLLICLVLLPSYCTGNTEEHEIQNLKERITFLEKKIDILNRELQLLREQYEKLAEERKQLLLEKKVRDIEEEVCRLRALPLRNHITLKTISSQELKQFIKTQMDLMLPPHYASDYAFCLYHLGCTGEIVDLENLIIGLYSEQTAGLYDDREKTLYVRDFFNLNETLTEVILAHEICHALQDQHFAISEMPIRVTYNDDRAMAAMSVLEGDATVLMSEYMLEKASLSLIWELPKMLEYDQTALNEAPYFITQTLLAPYLSGLYFITYAREVEGEGARNRVFHELPLSTEHILHPEKYFGPELDDPTSFTLPDISSTLGPDWARALTNVAGELSIRFLFEGSRSKPEAARIAGGWDGDVYQLYRKNNTGTFVLVWISLWDSTADMNDFYKSYSSLVRARNSQTTVEDTLRFKLITSSGASTFLRKSEILKRVTVIKTNDASLLEVLKKESIEPRIVRKE